jgi:hypothetical protein
MVISELALHSADEAIARAAPLLKAGGQIRIMVIVSNDRDLARASTFAQEFAHQSARLLNLSAWVTEIHYVPSSRMRWAIYRAMVRLARSGDAAGWRSPGQFALIALAAAPLTLATLVTNLGIRATATPPRRLWSSVSLSLRPSGDQPASLRPRASKPGTQASTVPRRTGEAARRREPDPNRLAQKLTFIADMIDSRQDVAEYGSVEALGSAMVRRKVKTLAVYDADTEMLPDLHGGSDADGSIAARVHDILDSPLPTHHDTIFSLDAIERVSRRDEAAFVKNLAASLAFDHGMLIIGGTAPSLDPDANGQGLIMRSAAELKALLARHFHVVLLFSMVGETIHPGIVRAADYTLVLVCARKTSP